MGMEPDPECDVPILPLAPNPSYQPLLRAAKSTAFKREERRKRKERKRQDRLALELAQWEPLGAPPRPATTSLVPPDDTPWQCDPPPDPLHSDAWSWGPPAETPSQQPQPPVAAACPQASAVRACLAFFGEHVDDEEEEEEEEDDDGEGGNVTRFFEELLEKDAGLRGLYKAERETGLFLCLVCEGVGARAGKRFAGCAALVQHAGSVARTKKRLAHRAFADAVGRLLGSGAGRTTSLPADSDNDGACDQVGHLDVSQSAEMEMF